MRSLKIVPLGEIPEEILNVAMKALRITYNIIADVVQVAALPKEAYNPLRSQFLSDKILEFLSRYRTKVLGITNEDLYTEGLNFVFGQAQLNGNVALVSICRLDPSFYRQPADKSLLTKRVVKEVIHEVGHTLGLTHCSDSNCVMSFSNTIFDVDRKSKNLCETCKIKLGN